MNDNNLDYIYKSSKWKKVRELVRMRDKNICAYCNKFIKGKAHIHHIQELKKENLHLAYDLNNLITLHQQCHNIVHDRFKQADSFIEEYNNEIDFEKRKKVFERKIKK